MTSEDYIDAFTALLKKLPDAPGVAFVFILHQDPRRESNLAHVLERATRMPVKVIQTGMEIETGGHTLCASGPTRRRTTRLTAPC
jgi:chemotaxis response regulator CheB